MNTISTTAISTENARSRNQERVFQMLPDDFRAGSRAISAGGPGVRLSFSCIRSLRHYRRFSRRSGCPLPSKDPHADRMARYGNRNWLGPLALEELDVVQNA